MGKYKLYGESLLRLGNGLFAGNALPPMEPRRICKTGWEYPRLDMKDKKCKKKLCFVYAIRRLVDEFILFSRLRRIQPFPCFSAVGAHRGTEYFHNIFVFGLVWEFKGNLFFFFFFCLEIPIETPRLGIAQILPQVHCRRCLINTFNDYVFSPPG